MVTGSPVGHAVRAIGDFVKPALAAMEVDGVVSDRDDVRVLLVLHASQAVVFVERHLGLLGRRRFAVKRLGVLAHVVLTTGIDAHVAVGRRIDKHVCLDLQPLAGEPRLDCSNPIVLAVRSEKRRAQQDDAVAGRFEHFPDGEVQDPGFKRQGVAAASRCPAVIIGMGHTERILRHSLIDFPGDAPQMVATVEVGEFVADDPHHGRLVAGCLQKSAEKDQCASGKRTGIAAGRRHGQALLDRTAMCGAENVSIPVLLFSSGISHLG